MNEHDLEFQEIWNAFQPKIQNYLTRMVGTSEAEDLTQEVFLKANQTFGKFRGDSQVYTWIYKIATNAALDKLRSSSYQNDKQNVSALELANEIADKEVLPADKQFVRQEMNSCIKGFVEDLPGNYRTVILLSEFEGHKNKEIADILGISIDTVKIRLHRARAKLRSALEDHCHFYHDYNNELACDLKTPCPSNNLQE